MCQRFWFLLYINHTFTPPAVSNSLTELQINDSYVMFTKVSTWCTEEYTTTVVHVKQTIIAQVISSVNHFDKTTSVKLLCTHPANQRAGQAIVELAETHQ
ncbi:hypothetical protein EG68_03460 [Paragonimus skrjabini miyazakii]|uniref:Uncharacterized protein n=1 Tax=Paragonimus skrjabini miyazakii TaxID=59628 RepID=A0A8S9YVQ5_9TREM|nr:hypothetical protein EG68_03460 [Paragonimus skrjabini miyazakii]